jgi:hypothetical protein
MLNLPEHVVITRQQGVEEVTAIYRVSFNEITNSER